MKYFAKIANILMQQYINKLPQLFNILQSLQIKSAQRQFLNDLTSGLCY